MKAALPATTAAEFDLVWTGGDRITIVDFGVVTFSTLDINTATRLETLKDANGNPIYVKKKVLKPAQKSTQPDKSS